MADIRKTIYPAKVVACQDFRGTGYNEVVINKGSLDGIREGQAFLVYVTGEEIFDPDTGKSLGTLEIVRGQGNASHVQETITTIRSRNRDSYPSGVLFNLSLFDPFSNDKQAGNLIPFNNVQKGDLVKPI
ncbi:MAG: hypothetical protein NTV32_07840 [Gammaproteobacteria bacterium]|nr:hypothetical protein [Gammaproteobacteria bacterium]